MDPRGLRLRLVDRLRGHAKIIVAQGAETVSNYAINLDSQPRPFGEEEVARAHERLKAPAFVSEATVDGEKWYRLRVGPIERRSEADRLLSLALPQYPRAWLAIGDDAVTSDANAPAAAALPPVEHIGSDPPLPPELQRQMLTEARKAVEAHDYPTAIALLTKLQRQPEYPERARAQELLGLARERAGQLAHAKAEYEEYLRRYPQGEAAERVAFRLRILRAAEAKARTGRSAGDEAGGWQLSGGFSQTGRYDGSRESNGSLPTNTPVPPAPQINENALFTDLDLLARRRGESYDWVGRLSAGYDKTFGQDTTGTVDPTRVSLASFEVLDRPLGLLARIGRQAYNQDGVLGTFDGLFVSWQLRPSWALNVAAGYPVEQLQLAPQTEERFETVAVAYTPPGAHWDASVFVAHQRFQELTDREAVGANMRYLASNVSMVAVVDYDIFYHSLNTASLLGTLQLPARWSVSVDAERRTPGPHHAQCPHRAAVHGPQATPAGGHGRRDLPVGAGPHPGHHQLQPDGKPPPRRALRVHRHRERLLDRRDARLRWRGGGAGDRHAHDLPGAAVRLEHLEDRRLQRAHLHAQQHGDRQDRLHQHQPALSARDRVAPRAPLRRRPPERRKRRQHLDHVHPLAADRVPARAWAVPAGRGRRARQARGAAAAAGWRLRAGAEHDALLCQLVVSHRFPAVIRARNFGGRFRWPLAALLWLAAATALAGSAPPQEYLDEETAATITVVGEPLVFANERRDLAANARDYVTVAAAAVNRSGKITYVVIAYFWSTVDPRLRPDLLLSPPVLSLQADDRRLELHLAGHSAHEAGIGRPVHEPPGSPVTPNVTARIWRRCASWPRHAT